MSSAGAPTAIICSKAWPSSPRFGDRIAVEPATSDRFAVTGPFAAAVPLDDGNLVLAARDRLRGALSGSAMRAGFDPA